MSRILRRVLLLGLLLALIAGAIVAVDELRRGPAWSAEEPARLFSSQSFWNQRLPDDAALATNSASLVRDFVDQIHGAYGTVGINTSSYSAPVYVVDRRVRSVRVRVTPCLGEPFDAAAAAALRWVPIPAGARPASGTDHDLIVLQPSTGREWELWEAHRDRGTWTACDGGELADVYSSDGVFPAPTGVAASGISILAGMIRFSDLRAGRIDHALDVAVPLTARYPAKVEPADRTDGWSDAPDAIAEGTRYRLDPDVDVAALHLTRLGAMVAHALQDYGMVVFDTAGAVSFQGQDPAPVVARGHPNPWAKLFGGVPSYKVLAGIPWGDLEALAPTAAG